MLEKDLKDIWSKSTQNARISIATNQLQGELQLRLEKIKKKIKFRDIREIAASVFGIVFCSFLAFEIPFLVCRLACLLSVIWFIYVIFKFRLSRKQNRDLDLSLPLAEQLKQQLLFMREQENLLDSGTYWYAIPPFIINIVFIIGLGDPLDYAWSNSVAVVFLPLSYIYKLLLILGLSLFYGFIIWMNKRVLSTEIEPLLESLEKNVENLE